MTLLTPDGRAKLQAYCLKMDREKKQRRRTMTPRNQWTHEMELEAALERIVPERDRALAARTKLQTELAALDSDRSRRMLTPMGRAEQREKTLKAAQANLSAHRQALTFAETLLERKAELTGTARVLREARFVPDDPKVYDDQVRELRLLREELTRQRLREELRDLPPDALAAVIREAGVSQQHALLHLAESVIARRKRDGERTQLDAAQSALDDARQAIEPPKDVAKLDALFTTLAEAARDLNDAIVELRTGMESDGVAAASRRIEQIAAEGDLSPLEVGQKFAVERQAELEARKQRATKRAERIVDEAIRADEADAAKVSE